MDEEKNFESVSFDEDDEEIDDIDFEDFGIFGNMRRSILQSYRPEYYEKMKSEGVLAEHLQSTQNEYAQKYDFMIRKQMEREGIPDIPENRGIRENIAMSMREILFDEMCPPEWIAEDFEE